LSLDESEWLVSQFRQLTTVEDFPLLGWPQSQFKEHCEEEKTSLPLLEIKQLFFQPAT
jgi:hypothetical protein